MMVHLVSQLYRPADERQWRQLLEVLRLNLARPEIGSATVFLEGCEPPWQQAGVHWQPVQERLSFGRAMAVMQGSGFERLPEHWLLLNSDIVLDASLARATAALRDPDQVLCCTRREADGRLSDLAEPMRSQDAWLMAWHPPTALLLEQLQGIHLGRPGCENVLAAVLWAHGYAISNPCLDWRVHHADAAPQPHGPGGERYWGLYGYVPPCRLRDLGRQQLPLQFQHAQAPGHYQWLDLR